MSWAQIFEECKLVLPEFTSDLSIRSCTEARGGHCGVRLLCRKASCPVCAQMSKLEQLASKFCQR